MGKDYYKILGIEKNASSDEIKKAFRKRAHEHHPDKKGGDEAQFKEVNEAYQVLGDEQKRKQYDQFGSDFESQGGFGGGMNWDDFMRSARGSGGFNANFGGVDLGDIFGDMFGFSSSRGGRRQKRGRDVQVDVEVSFEEAAFGVQKQVRLNKNNSCAVCSGNGQEPGSSSKTCGECKGQGQVTQIQRTIFGSMQTAVVCHQCEGSGKIPEKSCKQCGGKGISKSESSYTIKIPSGIHDGATIRLDEKGESGGANGAFGDLYVVVHILPHPHLKREENTVFGTVHISYPEAVLGTTVEVETLDGKKKIEIESGTESKTHIRLKGLGIPYLRSGGRGDMFVEVIVDVPKKVSREAKRLLEELQKELK